MTEQPRDPNRIDLTADPDVSADPDLPQVSGEAEYSSPAVSEETLDQIASANVYDVDGDKVGSVGRVYLRDETGNPSWVTVKSGFFGMRESLVPMQSADLVGDEIRVPYSKDVIKGAPHVDAGEHLSPAEEDELQRYYGTHGWRTDAHTDTGDYDDTGETRGVNPDVPPADPGAPDRAATRALRPGDTAETPPIDVVDSPEAEERREQRYEDTERREQRYEDMERRNEQLKDTTVEDALIAGSAGIAGAGVVTPESLPHHDHDVAGSDVREADVAGADVGEHHDVVGTDAGRDETAREREAVADDERSHSDVDREGPGHLASDDPDVLAQPAGVDPHVGVAASGVAVDTSWRESELDEVRDGGYGIGSAAPLGRGLQPLGHPVRGWEDTKSFRSGPAVGDERDPDVWFFDEQAAYNAGFHQAT